MMMLLAAAPSRWAAAQVPQRRQELLAFRDSLATVHDVTALRALERAQVRLAHTNRNDTTLHLRLGFIGLRLGDLRRNSDDYRDAVGEFQWAARLDSTQALAWYGLGMAEFDRALTVPPAIRNMEAGFLHDPIGQAAADLARSDVAPTPYPDGVAEVVARAQRLEEQPWMQFALAAVRDAAGTPGAATHDGVLARARIERSDGIADSALAVIATYLKRHPDDPTVLLEEARIRFIGGRTDGDVPWYRGLELADPATLVLYRGDLGAVANDTVREALAANDGTARVKAIARFWRTRDELSPDGAERLRDHYRRLNTAHNEHPLANRDTVIDALAAVDVEGRVVVRHGEPDATGHISLKDLPPNKAWWYFLPGGDSLLFVFAKGENREPERLLPGIHSFAENVIGDRTFHGLGDSARKANARMNDVLATRGAESPDTWSFGYELALPAAIALVAIGSDSTGPELQIAWSVPGNGVVPERAIDDFVYRLRLRAVLLDSASDVAGAVDTTVLIARDHWLPDDSLLVGRATLEAPAGHYTIRGGLESDGVGVVTPRETVVLAPLASPEMSMSDIALGRRGVPIDWPLAPGDTAWVDPSGAFPRSEPMEMTVQASGVPDDADYAVQLAVLKVPDSATAVRGQDEAALVTGSTMRIDFKEHHGHGIATIERSLSLGSLAPGWYVLQVRVAVQNGESRTHGKAFRVVK